MFCPRCGQRNEGSYKFCRGCGENLKIISKAMERRWRKLFYRALDAYIRYRHRKLPDAARSYRNFRWLWLALIGGYLFTGMFDDNKGWWVMALMLCLMLFAGLWDYVSYQRLSASGSTDDKPAAEPESLPDSIIGSFSIPTTNELTPPFSITEATTRRLEPLTAAEKRSGEL